MWIIQSIVNLGRQVLPYFWFSLGSAALILLTLKGVELLYRMLLDKSDYTVIAPFTLTGGTDTTNTAGIALATALQAKLQLVNLDAERIVSDFSLASETDKKAGDDLSVQREASGSSTRESQNILHVNSTLRVQNTLSYPTEGFKPPDWKVQVAGVDVGNILGWIYEQASTRNALRFTVNRIEKQAVVSGKLNRNRNAFLYETVDNNDDRIVAAIAYSMARDQLTNQTPASGGIPELGALKWQEVETLFNILRNESILSSQTKAGGLLVDEYKTQLASLEPILVKTPRWRDLFRIAAHVAIQARDFDLAIYYLNRALALANGPNDGRVRDTIVQDLETVRNSEGIEYVDELNGPKPDVLKFYGEALTAHKRLLEIDAVSLPRVPRIAIVVGIPFRGTLGYEAEVSGSDTIPPASIPGAYADTLALVVKTIAPTSHILFPFVKADPHGDILASELSFAINRALSMNPDVILIPFGTGVSSKVFQTVFDTLERIGCFVVLGSGNDPKQGPPFGVKEGSSATAVVGALDVTGRRVSISTAQPDVLWAPATQIPVLGPSGVWQIGSGSGLVAAIVAGVAANILAREKTETITPKQLHDLLMTTSRVVDPREPQVRVVSQKQAISALKNPTRELKSPQNIDSTEKRDSSLTGSSKTK
jgi:hypothetical protein